MPPATSADGRRGVQRRWRAQLGFRQAGAADRRALRAFLGRLSPRTVQTRFLSPPLALTGLSADREVDRILGRNERRHVVLLAVEGPAIRAMGEFVIEQAGRAELALLVEDAFQGLGLGWSLLRKLEPLARARGIHVFTGDVALSNARALAVLRRTGRPLQMQAGYGSLRFSLPLDA